MEKKTGGATPKMRKIDVVALLDALSHKDNTSVTTAVRNKKVIIFIKRPEYQVIYEISGVVFRNIYFDIPAWYVTKYFTNEQILKLIANLN